MTTLTLRSYLAEGKTKIKKLELHERNNIVDTSGTEEECRRARKCIELVRAQRVGPVHVDATHDDGDLTMVDVPSDCVGFVTGTEGNFLRTCEEEWCTLMFFCNYQNSSTIFEGVDRLALFESPAGVAGAELKVMAAIEAKKVWSLYKNRRGQAMARRDAKKFAAWY